MEFKDRTAAAESIIAQEERERSPVWEYIAKALDLLPDVLPKAVTSALRAFRGTIEYRIENLQYLHDALRDDMRDLQRKLENIPQEQAEFYQREIIPLIVDAHFKAEILRSKSKIKRIAAILIHALEWGPRNPSDYTEEMMRVATVLDDTDVEVLRQIVKAQKGHLGSRGSLDLNAANELWKQNPPSITGFSLADITSVCSKLESLGLLVRVERRDDLFGLDTAGLPYGLLKKGLDFVTFAIKESEP
jgi:hypothetical protein